MALNLNVISVPGPAMCSRPGRRAPSGNLGGVRDLEVSGEVPGLWFLFFVAFVLAPRYAK